MKITLELPDYFKVADRRCIHICNNHLCGGDKLEFQHVAFVNNELVFVFRCSDYGRFYNRHSRLDGGLWTHGGDFTPYKVEEAETNECTPILIEGLIEAKAIINGLSALEAFSSHVKYYEIARLYQNLMASWKAKYEGLIP